MAEGHNSPLRDERLTIKAFWSLTHGTPSRTFSTTGEVMRPRFKLSFAGVLIGLAFLEPGTAGAASRSPGTTGYSSVISHAVSSKAGSSNQPATTKSTGYLIRCNHAYSFTDGNGVFTMQHTCFSTTTNWGFRINAGICSTITSTVHETGMYWDRNGAFAGQQAPHDLGCIYQFHGTFNPTRGLDHITNLDYFTYSVGRRIDQVEVFGDWTILDSTCSPTSC